MLIDIISLIVLFLFCCVLLPALALFYIRAGTRKTILHSLELAKSFDDALVVAGILSEHRKLLSDKTVSETEKWLIERRFSGENKK